jgi:hypothetical protein
MNDNESETYNEKRHDREFPVVDFSASDQLLWPRSRALWQ